MLNKAYRSSQNKIIAGVCGGLSQYFNADPNLIRAFFVILLFLDGLGIWAYLLLWIILPEKLDAPQEQNTPPFKIQIKNNFVALFLMGLGAILLLNNLVPRFTAKIFWPMILIIIGLAILSKNRNKTL
jgi:phage shock protein PspC (stress-responsive transcriptional regulator)